MNITKNKKKVLEFIKNKNLGVLSTINKFGNPESAVVAFSETEDLQIIFGTFNTTRKYSNLQLNQTISFVIGWDEGENVTVQYEGIVREVTDLEFQECRDIQLKKNPSSKTYAFEKQQRYFKITPIWIRYSDLSKEPEEIFEISFE